MLKKFNDFKPSTSVNEALKMLIRPLMVDIMRAFGFKRDPNLRAELEAAIEAAVKPVLISHGIIVEGKAINRFSPMSYAERVASGDMELEDAAKEAKMPITELLALVKRIDKKFKWAIAESEDHEVGMAQGQLAAIHQAATELQEKIGMDEKNLPGWIQDHISQAYNYIKQANDGYHELEEAMKLSGGNYIISPVMMNNKIAFSFIGDSKTVDSKTKGEIASDIQNSLRKLDKQLAEVFVYDEYNDAAGVVFKMDPYGMIEYLEKKLK